MFQVMTLKVEFSVNTKFDLSGASTFKVDLSEAWSLKTVHYQK